MTVLAAAERGGLLRAPDVYMEKIIVGPTARGVVHLDAPVPENLRNIAKAFGREVTDLTIVVLDRERHERLIADIREAGSRIRLIPDGDLAAGISVAVRGTSVHAVMGTGGAPEGVIAAAAMRCLGGEIQGRLRAVDSHQEKRLTELGSRQDRHDLHHRGPGKGREHRLQLHRRHRRRAAARGAFLRWRHPDFDALHVARGRHHPFRRHHPPRGNQQSGPVLVGRPPRRP